MPCEPIIEKGKVTGFMCSRSRSKPKPPPCDKCGKPSTKLCDFRDYEKKDYKNQYGYLQKTEIPRIDTCDTPMCDECANYYGNDTDYCDRHNNARAIAVSEHAEQLHKWRLKQFGIEE